MKKNLPPDLRQLARWQNEKKRKHPAQSKHLPRSAAYFRLQSVADVQYVVTFFIMPRVGVFSSPLFCRVCVFAHQTRLIFENYLVFVSRSAVATRICLVPN